MTNRKDLKRTINQVCGDLFAECIAVASVSNNHEHADVDALLATIIRINSEFVTRISHVEPGMKAHDYFQKLINDFNKQVCEIVDQINNIC